MFEHRSDVEHTGDVSRDIGYTQPAIQSVHKAMGGIDHSPASTDSTLIV
jgi:hypothetical protein